MTALFDHIIMDQFYSTQPNIDYLFSMSKLSLFKIDHYDKSLQIDIYHNTIMDKIKIKLKNTNYETPCTVDQNLLTYDNCDIFTPDNISEKMAGFFIFKKGSLLDPACGTGNLLKFIKLDEYDSVDLYDIKENYLQMCPDGHNISKSCSDFLFTTIDKKFDNIIMNPPYIRCQNLSDAYKNKLKSLYGKMYDGNIDIYYFFIIKCMQLLSDDGTCVIITPNSWLYNKSAHTLRQLLFGNNYVREIIDFNSQKVFNGVSTYCCITILDKKSKSTFLYNNRLFNYDIVVKNIDNIFETKEINSGESKIKDLFIVSNGIATLCDKVFVHDQKLYDEPCWKPIYCGNGNYKWIIYPYDEQGKNIFENDMMALNPKTFDFLVKNKSLLDNRDKGKAKYPTFYSYGRTQAVKLQQNTSVVFMSLFTDPNNIDIRECKTTLYKNCICICARDKSANYTNVINCIRLNKATIERKSSKRGGGWINISTTTIKDLYF
jgi:hypothetical protein